MPCCCPRPEHFLQEQGDKRLWFSIASVSVAQGEQRRLFRNTDLVIPKEGTPGTTAEHEGLHQRSLGLNRVIQIVSGPGGLGDQAVTSHSLIIVREFDLMQGISDPFSIAKAAGMLPMKTST